MSDEDRVGLAGGREGGGDEGGGGEDGETTSSYVTYVWLAWSPLPDPGQSTLTLRQSSSAAQSTEK